MPAKKKISDKVDKRLRAKVTVGTGIDGEPVIKYASGRSKKELEANKKELERAYITGAEEERREILFGVYVEEWYAAYKKDKLSPSSQANYSTAIYKHLFPVFKNRQMRAIRAVELQNFMNSKAGMGKTSIGDMYSILVNVFARATAQGVIDRNPALGLTRPATKRESRRPLNDIEVAATFSVAKTHPDGLLLLLLYYTGMRRGEVLGLQWQDIDFAANVIHVRRDMDFVTGELGELKSQCSRRSIPMPKELSSALNAVRGIGSTPVLQSPKTHQHWGQATFVRRWNAFAVAMYESNQSIESKVIAEIADENGNTVPVMGSILTPHYYRHNYASILYNAGVDVLAAQKILGHADVKTTLSIYAHLGKQKEAQSHKAIIKAFDTSKKSKVAKKLPE